MEESYWSELSFADRAFTRNLCGHHDLSAHICESEEKLVREVVGKATSSSP